MSPSNPRVFYHHQLPKRRKPRKRPVARRPELSVPKILAWADEFRRRAGRWPTEKSGRIPGSLGETWNAVSQALREGLRGLQPGSSLARLLAEHRGARNLAALPPLSEQQILAWADAHFRRAGRWPGAHSGPIPEAPGETWTAVEMALSKGRRGLPGGSSLARLLGRGRGAPNHRALTPLTHEQILAWADEFCRRTGRWPTCHGGPIPDSGGERWESVDSCLRDGRRGLPGGYSLTRLLADHRGARNDKALPRLTRRQVLAWADAHHRRTGAWPNRTSGRVPEAPAETWNAVDLALRRGSRGLTRGGSSLPKLLAEHRGVRNRGDLPKLSEAQVLRWAEAHFRRNGAWPSQHSGPILDAPGETWSGVDSALYEGIRGLPGGSSLARLLAQRR